MDTTQRAGLMQRWHVIQAELIPDLGREVAGLTPRLEKVIHILEWVRIEAFVPDWIGLGRPPKDRGALANAFVAKAVLGLPTTVALIKRLTVDRALRRICGFSRWVKLPDEATFSRAFACFTSSRLAERVHEALIKAQLGDQLIGHISRDGTAIIARERPARQTASEPATPPAQSALPEMATPVAPEAESTRQPRKRGRLRRGDVRTPVPTRIERQRGQTLAQMIAAIPTACDRGTKCNAQGYKVSWNGYKLHLDTTDCGVVVSALLTSASVHDSQTAIPLSRITADRVTHCYDLMDAAYCSAELRADSRERGHVPLIDHNPRGGVKIEFDPAEALRYRERTVAERMNARLKDEFDGRNVWVRGDFKVMSHLMLGILVLAADQLMRLLQ
jgi:hypothetical protein